VIKVYKKSWFFIKTISLIIFLLFYFSSCQKKNSPSEGSLGAAPTPLPPSHNPSPTPSPIPSKPQLNHPPIIYTNQTSYLLKGSCEDTYKILIKGSSLDESIPCYQNQYEYLFSIPEEKEYHFNIYQISSENITSTAQTLEIIVDRTPPAQPLILSPNKNPFYTSDEVIQIQGQCETNADVFMIKKHENTLVNQHICENEFFIFKVSQNKDTTEIYQIFQKDLALNASQNLELQITHQSNLIPPSITLTSPENPHIITNNSKLEVKGQCLQNHKVEILGISLSDIQNPYENNTLICENDTFSFILNKEEEGTLTLDLIQTDLNFNSVSPSTQIYWTFDKTPPSPPTLIFPSFTPFLSSEDFQIILSCEKDSTVYLNKSNQESKCLESHQAVFNLSTEKEGEEIYLFTQKDRAGNISEALSFTWIKNINSIQSPLITFPIKNPFLTNDPQLHLEGKCESGLKVILTEKSNNPQSYNLEHICTQEKFSFKLNKIISDQYIFNLYQTNEVDIISDPSTFTWLLDQIPPITTITSTPPSPHLESTATFFFESNEPHSQFTCKINNEKAAACTSPIHYSIDSLFTDTINTFTVWAKDLAGNLETEGKSYQWNQMEEIKKHKTVALYKFENIEDGTIKDYSLFSKDYQSPLQINTLSTQDLQDSFLTQQKDNFKSIRIPEQGELKAEDNSLQRSLLQSEFTLEGFIFIQSLTPELNTALISKEALSGGWTLHLSRVGRSPNYRLQFSTKYIEYNENNISTLAALEAAGPESIINQTFSSGNFSLSTNTLYHFAMTFQKGQIVFYLNRKLIGTVQASTNQAVIWYGDSPASIRIGSTLRSNISSFSIGLLDEFRLSNILRYKTSQDDPILDFNQPTFQYLLENSFIAD